jgi:hypothetical protein
MKPIWESPVLKALGKGLLPVAKTVGKAAWQIGKTATVRGNLGRAVVGGVAGGIYGAINGDPNSSSLSDQSILSGMFAGAILGAAAIPAAKGALQTVGSFSLNAAKQAFKQRTLPGTMARIGFNNAGLILGGGVALGTVGVISSQKETYSSSLDSATLSTPVNQMAIGQEEQTRYGGGQLLSVPNVRNRRYENSTNGLVQALSNRRHG